MYNASEPSSLASNPDPATYYVTLGKLFNLSVPKP